MEIAELGYYRTRGGRKARVICVDADKDDKTNFAVVAITPDQRLCYYAKDGGRTVNGQLSSEDIIEKWIDKPVIDWKYLPAWATYSAMDRGGDWHWFDAEPEMDMCSWCLDEGGDASSGEIPKKFQPVTVGGLDWKDSLLARPNAEPGI